MAAQTPSLVRVYDLLRELRLSIRKIEVAAGTREGEDDAWTRHKIEAFNNASIRTVAACRDALTEARYEGEQREAGGGGGGGTDGGSDSLTKVVQAERDLEHVRMELRRAVTIRKRHEERRYDATSRAALLGAEGGDGPRRRGYNSGGGGDDAPGSAAGDAREMKQSLQRTRKMMAEQLARVAQVSEVMGEQDALLTNTFAEHQASFSCSDQGTGIGGSLKRAGTTLTRLKAAEVMDTIIMVASTFVFFATVCFVIYQRLPLLGLL
ncbi:unnamed protein product [Ectocarpus sp. 13 AM-2016]